jgi:hypothetical protein
MLHIFIFSTHFDLETILGPKSTSVDRRPSKVLVSGITMDEKDTIVEHFLKFGEIIETTVWKIIWLFKLPTL